MNGETLLDELGWRKYHLPVIMMSGNGDERALQRLLKEGATAYFMKPFDVGEMAILFHRVFGESCHQVEDARGSLVANLQKEISRQKVATSPFDKRTQATAL